jgi:hypothetical protein
MEWDDELKVLTEQIEILNALKEKFGEAAIAMASQARLTVHQRWIREIVKANPIHRPSQVFHHSAFSVTTGDDDLLKYTVLEDTDRRYRVKITGCKYADIYREKGCPEIGYAMHCALDFDEVKVFKPKVVLKRKRTLMLGDAFCDHCYEFL